MIISFGNIGTEEIFHGADTPAARRACPRQIWKVARRKLVWLAAARTLRDLQVPPANRLEALKGDRKGQCAIRINDQYRVCFRWTRLGAEDVEIVDYY